MTRVRDKQGCHAPAASGHFEAVWFPARAELVSRLALLGQRLWTAGQEETSAGKPGRLRPGTGSNTAPCWAAVQLCDLWYMNWGWTNDWWGSESVKYRLRLVSLHQSLFLVKPWLLLCLDVCTHTHVCLHSVFLIAAMCLSQHQPKEYLWDQGAAGFPRNLRLEGQADFPRRCWGMGLGKPSRQVRRYRCMCWGRRALLWTSWP